MKIKDGFILREVAGSHVVLPVGKRAEEFNGAINLSGSAVEIWKFLEKDTTIELVVSGLKEIYDIDEETLKADATAFIGKLRGAGLLDE